VAGPGIRDGLRRRRAPDTSGQGTTPAPWQEVRTRVARELADQLGVPRALVTWDTSIPQLHGGDGMVVRTPWARVVVARTPTSARRFAKRWVAGQCDWLVDALGAAYPTGLTEWLPAARLLEQTGALDKAHRTFLAWSLPRISTGFRAAPDVWVLGSWATWRDAVLVARQEPEQTDGWAYQLRGEAPPSDSELAAARAHLLKDDAQQAAPSSS